MFLHSTNAGLIRRLADAMVSCPIAETVDYATLSAAISRSAQDNNFLVQAGRRLANRENGALFRNVRTVGYLRLPSEQAHAVGKTARRSIRRAAKRAGESISNAIVRTNDMSNAARIAAFSEQAALGLIHHMSMDRNIPKVSEGAMPPTVENTVRATLDALKAHQAAAGR